MFEPISTTALMLWAGEIFKVWVPVGTLFLGLYKGFQWVKTKFINIDANVIATKEALVSVQEEIKHQTHALTTALNAQSQAFTSALNEQRADFRTFYLPFMLQNQQSLPVPARAKRVVRKRVKKT